LKFDNKSILAYNRAILLEIKGSKMTKQFVQVSAHKDSDNFMHCSNLSLMANQGLTAKQALRQLQVMADEYALNGYSIEWIRQDFDAIDEEMYGELFV
jgi:hypothetical protein